MKLSKRIHLFKRNIRFFFQRLFRGWDDSETWNLDHSLAKLILPRLKKYRELHMGYPAIMDNGETWDVVVDKMIFSFEILASDKAWDIGTPEEDLKIQEGLDLFAKYYRGLWD